MKNAAARPGHGMRVSALAATERRCAGQAKQIEFASRRRLRVAGPERQAEIRRRLKFDAGMRAISRQCAGRGVEGRKRAADAGVVFQGVETGIDGKRQPAQALKIVAGLHAFIMKRAAERAGLVDAADAETRAAGSAADKPAVRKINARRGKAAGVAAVEACKAAVNVRALADGQVALEADWPA